MGTYRKGWLLSAVLAGALLTACQEEAAPKEVETTDTKQQEIVKVEVPSQEALVALVNQHFQGITSALNQAGIDFNIQDGNVTDAIYDGMKEKLKTFATSAYIDGNLKKIAQAYCYSGCDFPYFPQDLQSAVDVQMEQVSNTEVKLVGTQAANMLSPTALKEEIYISYEDGLWKINQTTSTETILNLTADQALQVAKQNGYDNPQFIEEKLQKVNGEAEEKVYRFAAGEEKFVVTAASGYIDIEAVATPAPTPTPATSDAIANGTLFEEYDAKKRAVWNEQQRLAEAFDGYTTVEINEHTQEIYQLWDDLLNDMYGALKKHLSASEFEALRAEQRQWIKERDAYAEEAAAHFEGGTAATSAYTSALAEKTEDRCEDLLMDYMRIN